MKGEVEERDRREREGSEGIEIEEGREEEGEGEGSEFVRSCSPIPGMLQKRPNPELA